MMSYFGVNFPTTAFGDLRTAELTPQFQGSFEYTASNTELSTNVVTAGGSVTQSSAMAVVGTSTTTGSDAMLKSRRHARYRSGFGGLLRFTALFTAGVAATEQYVGLLDEAGVTSAFKNGLAIGFDGATFGFHRFVNDTKVTVAQSAWDDPLDGSGASGLTLDATKLNVWAINYQYLGAGNIFLEMEDPNTGDFVRVHQIKYAGLNTTPSTLNPNYHFIMWADNIGTTSDLIVKTASYAYFVEGATKHFELQQPQQSSGEKSKAAVTTELAIFTIRNKSTYASKSNFVDVLIECLTASIETASANNLGRVRLVKDATLGGVPSYADINTTDSVVDIDVAGTTVAGGKEVISVPLAGKNDKDIVNLSDFDIVLAHGETLTVSGISANSATINAALLWKELF